MSEETTEKSGTPFVHLHVHSHYSLLDGMSKVPKLVDKALEYGMNALALTDHGNMFGCKEFFDYVEKINSGKEDKDKFKPILGVEGYCARRSRFEKTDKEDKSGWHIILLAKNKQGYKNLCKLVSTSWIDGYYYRPRIDKKCLEQYHEGLIVSSACLGGEVPQKIMKGDLKGAKEAVLWFKSIFGDDFYLEIQRHRTDKPGGDRETFEKQSQVIPYILQLGEETGTKVIATNDVHFIEEEHSEAHDRLICLSTGKDLDDPDRMHYTKQEWFKSPAQMYEIFSDHLEVLRNTQELADKVEFYTINSDAIMPKFDIPETFGTIESYREKYPEEALRKEFDADDPKRFAKLGGYEKVLRIKLESDYLGEMTYEGAKERYGDPLPDEVKERISFELETIKMMGFPGYFLIVQDFISAARKIGVSVGPGRGSAAGSAVAFCLGITALDPLKYDLLFERFLNPDRISMPDIDIDFDDDGRQKVLKWVTNKYGKKRVAHIITYGTMATKNSIKDVARVQRMPLSEANRLTGLIPDHLPEDPKTGKSPKVNLANCIKYVPAIQEALNSPDRNVSDTIKYASMLEGTVRQTGIHACGVIIGADDLTNFAPLATAKEKGGTEDVLVTQYEGSVIESVGLIKMDFLGLKTLSILKETLSNIKQSKGMDVDLENIPIDDKKTYELYSRGETVGTFQFESAGMQKYLKELQPTQFEDLIAMNALYRPGPMAYIPQFINRKHGLEPITYDIPVMEKYLKDTYGITVYQEQVMLLSRLLADFTRGESDTLRKAMGKKQKEKLDHLKPKFIEGGKAKGYDQKVLEKIWADWESFASYAFNKSHATCYSWVSYQTAYLKAHYPAEFMAANLTCNRDDIGEITKFMDECRRMGLGVKGPDVNESYLNFTVNKAGDIRFGLGGVKGVGRGAVEAMLEEREKNGPFRNIFDFVERINLTACNKKNIEALCLSGAFDSFTELSREQYFAENSKGESFIESLIKYGSLYHQDKANLTNSLFGGSEEVSIARPEIPKAEKWSNLERLEKEKELVGIYLSSHPLDEYYILVKHVCNMRAKDLESNLENAKGKDIMMGGIVTAYREGFTKKGNPYGIAKFEDYSGSVEIPLFGKDFIEFGKYFHPNMYLFIRGTVQARKYRENELEFKILGIQQLSEVKDNLINRMTIFLPLLDIDDVLIEDLYTFIMNNPGDCSLFFKIEQNDGKMKVSLQSGLPKFSVSLPLVRYLEQKDLQFTIN